MASKYFAMLKLIVVAALAAAVYGSPSISSLSLAQRLSAIQNTVSISECVPCEEAMGTAIHTGADSGNCYICGMHVECCVPHLFY